jgi:hypothetical protein
MELEARALEVHALQFDLGEVRCMPGSAQVARPRHRFSVRTSAVRETGRVGEHHPRIQPQAWIHVLSSSSWATRWSFCSRQRSISRGDSVAMNR